MGHAHDADDTPMLGEQDPAHDVDGKKLALWLGGSFAGVFLTVYILLLAFEEIMHHQRHVSVELGPTTQRDALRATEDADLSGAAGSVSIDAAIKAYVEKKR